MPMPAKQKASLDEIMTKRQGNVIKTPRGDAIFKVATKAPRSFDAEARSARFVMTSETVDRYGDIVRQAGLQIDRFLENPQALMFHDSRNWPIGGWSNITKVLTGRPKRTEGDLDFMEEGADPDADRACTHVAAGTIRAVSIGFMPIDWESINDDGGHWTGYDFIASELYECSLVPIPAQPDALAKAAGRDDKLLLCLLEEALDNYDRTPEGLILPKAEYEKAYRTVRTKLAPAEKPAELPVTDDEKTAAALRAVEFEITKLCPPVEGAVVAMVGDVGSDNAAVPGIALEKFAVEDGKWKHSGILKDGDRVNYVVETKAENEKTVYTLAHKYAPALERGENGWAEPVNNNDVDATIQTLLASLEKGDSVCIESDMSAQLLGEDVHQASRVPNTERIQVRAARGRPNQTLAVPGITEAQIKTIVDKVNLLNVADAPTGEITLTVGLDTDAIETEMNSLATMMESFRERIFGIFSSKQAPKERVEPTLDTPAPPSADQIAAARTSAAATRQRAETALA